MEKSVKYKGYIYFLLNDAKITLDSNNNCIFNSITYRLYKGSPNSSYITGISYLLNNGIISDNINGGQGIPSCVINNYNCILKVDRGYIDDYGTICGKLIKNNTNCPNGMVSSVPQNGVILPINYI